MVQELPEGLFNSFGENKQYKFMSLDGKVNVVNLKNKDYLSNQKCPIDGTNFVMVDDGVYTWNKRCYCCEGPILNTDIRGEEAEKWVTEKYPEDLKKEIEKKKDEISRLENLLAIATNRDSEILRVNRDNLLYSEEYNKPNLSEQDKKCSGFKE